MPLHRLLGILSMMEVSNQMLELYEQNRAVPPPHGNEAEGGPVSNRPSVKGPVAYEEPSLQNGSQRTVQNGSNDLVKEDPRHHEPGNVPESNSRSNYGSERPVKEDPVGRFNYGSQRPVKEELGGKSNYGSERPVKEESEVGTITPGGTAESKNRSSGHSEGPKGHSPMDAIGKIDRDKVKAALEKRRKSRAGVDRKMDIMDDDDLIERELESGIEMTAEDESTKQETPSGSDPYWQEPQNIDHEDEKGYGGTENVSAEEGELSLETHGFHYSESSGRKRKTVSPGNPSGVKDGFDHLHYHAPLSKHRESVDDSREGRPDRGDSRGHKRHRQENQV